jgi:hypothetical protein
VSYYSTERRAHRQNAMERRYQRKNQNGLWLFLLVGGVAGLVLAVELGRAHFYMQRVERFAATIERKSPAEVKQEVARFADGLSDRNPLISRSAMSAMKLATGWRLGGDWREWSRLWNDHQKDWEYQKPLPASAQTNAPVKPRWVDMLPPQVTQTSVAPPAATSSPNK